MCIGDGAVKGWVFLIGAGGYEQPEVKLVAVQQHGVHYVALVTA